MECVYILNPTKQYKKENSVGLLDNFSPLILTSLLQHSIYNVKFNMSHIWGYNEEHYKY